VSGDFLVLAQRIEDEAADLARVVQRAQAAITASKELPDYQGAFLDSAALNIHDFYSGLERIFQQIAVKVDGSLPEGRDWHRELLRQLHVALPPHRPAVISEATMESLQEFLGFRHVVRNVYAFQFQPERVEVLVNALGPVFEQVREELATFTRFLGEVSTLGES
jgi:hypothetical protein